MGNFESIPPSAREGVAEPDPALKMKCHLCGSRDTKTLSMTAMLTLPSKRVVNVNTFLLPNVALGYIQCPHCEDKQERSSWPWWKRLLV